MCFKVARLLFLIPMVGIAVANEPSINLEELFAQHQQMSQQLKKEGSSPELLIFISFSMPKESLKPWAEQAVQAGGTLLLRGLHENSIRKTLAKVRLVFGENFQGNLKIDPESFQKYHIQSVPSVVVVNQDQYDIISGDIPLDVALEKIKARHD